MLKVAIVGATGLVGRKIIQVLYEEGFWKEINLFLFASEKNYGKKVIFYDKEFYILKLSEKIANEKFDVVFFSAGDEVSKRWVRKFANSGAYVIDNTNAFRRYKYVPLVVPEINSNKIKKSTKIIANPNCSTIELAVVLDRLSQLAKLNKVIVSTYQSVSGAGYKALLDLENDTTKFFKCGIKNNLIAQIGSILDNGFCTEENKIMFELQKILDKSFDVLATTVRVPMPYCHGESVYVEFDDKLNLTDVYEKLMCEYIKVDKDTLSFPKQIMDTNKTHVCRIREVNETELLLFIVADNLRRGASYNAVQIFKYLLENNFLIKN